MIFNMPLINLIAELTLQLFTSWEGAVALLTLTTLGFIGHRGRKRYRRAVMATDNIFTLIVTIEGLKKQATSEIKKLNKVEAWMLNRKLKKRGITCSISSSDS